MRFTFATLLLVLSVAPVQLNAQGVGRLNRVGQGEVLRLASGLTNGMRVNEVRAYLAGKGLEPDLIQRDTNCVQTICYVFGSQWSNRACLFVRAKAPPGTAYDTWRGQDCTNSFLFSAETQSNGVTTARITLKKAR